MNLKIQEPFSETPRSTESRLMHTGLVITRKVTPKLSAIGIERDNSGSA